MVTFAQATCTSWHISRLVKVASVQLQQGAISSRDFVRGDEIGEWFNRPPVLANCLVLVGNPLLRQDHRNFVTSFRHW